MRRSCLKNAYLRTLFQRAISIHKVGLGDLVLLCGQDSLIGLCMHDSKSLCAAASICATQVNI